MFDTRRIVAAAGENVVKVYDKTDGRHWDCGGGDVPPSHEGGSGRGDYVGGDDEEEEGGGRGRGIVERVRIKDGYLTEGRKDGSMGIWSC